jgi:hypothetical protein
MAIVLKATTQKDQRLALVCSSDDAIDLTKCDVAEFISCGNDNEKLTFIEGKEPTVFWFAHPKRLDSKRILADIMLENGGVFKLGTALEKIWHTLFEGISEGFLGKVQKQKVDSEFIQALHDAGVFQELGNAFFLRSQEKSEDASKKN